MSGVSLPGRFLGWWGRELAACLPGRRAGARPRRMLRLAERDGEPHLSLLERGRETPLGSLAAIPERRLSRLARDAARGRLAVALAVPEDRAVRRRVALPLAAEREIAAVLGYEIDRLTPFRAAELYWGHSVIRRMPAAGRLEAEIVFAPRAEIEPAIAALGGIGLRVSRIEVGEEAAPDLMPAPPPRRWTAGSRATAALAVLLVCLGLGWAGAAWWQEGRELAALSEAVDRARRAALAGAEAAPETDTAALAAWRIRSAAPPAAETVALVTDLLPDHTVLDGLRIERRMVAMTGRSGDAAALIAAFEGHPRFRDPVFRTPIMRDGETGRERFSLSVRIVGPGDGG